MTTDTTARVSGTIKERAELIRDALRFANLAAGEGIEIDGMAPEDFLMAYSAATGDEDWDTFADRLAAIQPDPQPVTSEIPMLSPAEPQPVATRSCTELVAQLSAALEDAINAPKGVVPKSAEPFYDGFQGRVRMPDPDMGTPITPDPEPQPVAWPPERIWAGSPSMCGNAFGDWDTIKGHDCDVEYIRADLAHAAIPSSAGMVSVEAAEKIAEAIEACDWAGVSIGNKMILRAAVAALRGVAGERG